MPDRQSRRKVAAKVRAHCHAMTIAIKNHNAAHTFYPLSYELSREQGVVWPEVPQPTRPQLSENVTKAVRAMLRAFGHKPSGRGRPASETLLKALDDGRYPSIHPVVDYFNNLSLQTGVPVSVLDLDKMRGSYSYAVGGDESYVFNPSGQELKLTGLITVGDQDGPVGSPVKDSQRTKISADSERFLVVIWGTSELPDLMKEIHEQIVGWAADHKLDCRASREF